MKEVKDELYQQQLWISLICPNYYRILVSKLSLTRIGYYFYFYCFPCLGFRGFSFVACGLMTAVLQLPPGTGIASDYWLRSSLSNQSWIISQFDIFIIFKKFNYSTSWAGWLPIVDSPLFFFICFFFSFTMILACLHVLSTCRNHREIFLTVIYRFLLSKDITQLFNSDFTRGVAVGFPSD